MRLRSYIGKRLLFLIPQLVGIASLVFITLRVLPGDPAVLIVGPLGDEETIQAVTEGLGLDQPLHLQYFRYLGDLVRLDLGSSWSTTNTVVDDLGSRLPATVELITLGTLIGLFIGILLGAIAALWRNTVWDHLIRLVSLSGISMPNFWLGLIFIFLFSFLFSWFPSPLGRIGLAVDPPRDITGLYVLDSLLTLDGSALKSSLRHIALPAFTMSFIIMSPIVKTARSSIIEAMTADYVTHTRVSGLSIRRTRMYAIRGALPPIITILGVLYSHMLGGAVLIEVIYSWPGVAKYAVDSIINTDYAPVQGFVVLAAAWTVLVYLIVDILYVSLDPRITYH